MVIKGKNSKDVDVISALKTFEATLKAASRRRAIAVHRPLLEHVQQCQEASKPLVNVVLTGTNVHSAQVTVIADCLASYPPVKSLSCLGCNLDDAGLVCISALLQASGRRWWRGCRLQTLEMTGTSGQASEGTAAQQGTAGGTRQDNTTEQHRVWGSSTCLWANARPCTAPPESSASLPRQQYGTGQCRPSTGICPALPDYLQLPNSQQHAQHDHGLCSLRQVQYRVRTGHRAQAPKTIMEVRAWALAPTLGTGTHRRSAPASPVVVHPDPPPCCFSSASLQPFALALGASGLQLQRLVLDYTVLQDQGASILAAGIGCCSSLEVLSLCYCTIGLSGAQILADALKPACKPHSQDVSSSSTSVVHPAGSRMSMASVSYGSATLGAGSSAAQQSAAAGHVMAVRGANRIKPALVELHLSGNPIGAGGLHAVSRAVTFMQSLTVLSLADISLDPASQACQLEVQVLAHSLTSGPTTLRTLDFADNIIGDDVAMFFIGLLKAKTSLTLLKLTPRVSPSIMQQLSALLDEHQRAAKTKRVTKKAVKPAAA